VTTALAVADDGFDAVAADDSLILGDFMKFKKGVYVLNQGGNEKFNGAVMVVGRVFQCWKKWADKQLVDTILPTPGKPLPETVEDIEDDGTPGEWAFTSYLYLQSQADGREFTFVTSSDGGTYAVKRLAGGTRRIRRQLPGAFPRIRLDSALGRSKLYGEYDKPRFTVMGWVRADGQPYTAESHAAIPDAFDEDIPTWVTEP
jgi:hypothetical protein